VTLQILLFPEKFVLSIQKTNLSPLKMERFGGCFTPKPYNLAMGLVPWTGENANSQRHNKASAKRVFHEINCRLEVWCFYYITMVIMRR